MGFGDKLKGLKDQAQQAVAENKDKIQDAVQVVGEAANTKTHGKYAMKIAKVGEKVESSVDKFAAGPEESAQEPVGGAPQGAAPQGAAPQGAAPQGAAPQGAAPQGAAPQGGAPQEESADAPIVDQPANPVTPSAADTAASGFPEFE